MLKTTFVPIEIPDIKRDIPNVFASDYSVTVDGVHCQIRLCRESALPFNRIWPGYQRSTDQTEIAGFVSFTADKAVKVCIENMKATGSAPVTIRPLSRKVSPSVNGGKIEFELTEPGQYVLENGSAHCPLYIFFDPSRQNNGAKAKWHFGPGVHFPGTIVLSSGDSVYIDPDAIVFGSIYGNDVHGVRIFGGGTLHGGNLARVFRSITETLLIPTIKFYNSTDIQISDIIIQDAPCWVVSFWNCSEIDIDFVKIVGQWRYNTDGIDICNSDNVQITRSFVRAFDDAIVMKGMDYVDYRTVKWQKDHPLTDINVKECVLWCGWGRTLEVGIETAAPEYARILFENCDLIHNSAVCMDIQNGLYADIHDITFRNIRIEYQTDTLPEVYQAQDDQKYDQFDKMGVPILIFADNHRYFTPPHTFGSIHDILYENIAVTVEAGVTEKLKVRIANISDDATVGNFTIRNLTINGRRVSGPDDVFYDTEGRVGTVRWE